MADTGKYHSSRSINNPDSRSGMPYSANRNGQRAAYNPQTNTSKQNNKQNNINRQTNIPKRTRENEEEEPELAKLGAEQQIKKAATKKTLTEAAKAYNPAVGVAVEKALETKKGDEYLDEFAKSSSVSEGVKNVVKKANDESKKKRMLIIAGASLGPILFFLCIVGAVLGKNADTMILSHEINYHDEDNSEEGNDKYEEKLDITEYDDGLSNIYTNYPGLYETVSEKVKNVTNDSSIHIVIDKHLILATLIAPIENGLIQPVEGEECPSFDYYDDEEEDGRNLCYRFRDEYGNVNLYSYKEFLQLWGDLSELLAKMQIMTYSNMNTLDKGKFEPGFTCSVDDPMEIVATHDKAKRRFTFWDFIQPWNWFREYNNMASAELNVKCTNPPDPSGGRLIPDVKVLSIDRGIYYLIPRGTDEYDTVKDSNSGGVYFWNLLNQEGFIDTYFKDYLSYDQNLSDDENYKNNLPKILEIVNYIYSYYDSIRLDCDDRKVIDSDLDKIKVYNPPEKQASLEVPEYEMVDFEDQYVGGVLMAELASGGLEAEKAMAILARTEAAWKVGVDGKGYIENSSNNQNYNGRAYNPTYDSKIGIVLKEDGTYEGGYDPDWPKNNLKNNVYQAVQETRGVIITKFGRYDLFHTEYDNFCPQTSTSKDGYFYLPQGQQELPILEEKIKEIMSQRSLEKSLECPCFYNLKNMPHDDYYEDRIKYTPVGSPAPTEPRISYPEQATNDTCWNIIGQENKMGTMMTKWQYHATGGHGRGASQQGLVYFESYGYGYDGLIGLFYKDISYRKLNSSIPPGTCQNAKIYAELDKK